MLLQVEVVDDVIVRHVDVAEVCKCKLISNSCSGNLICKIMVKL